MSQSPSQHAVDAGFFTLAAGWLTGVLPQLYQWLEIILVCMGIAWYARQFYLSFKNKKVQPDG